MSLTPKSTNLQQRMEWSLWILDIHTSLFFKREVQHRTEHRTKNYWPFLYIFTLNFCYWSETNRDELTPERRCKIKAESLSNNVSSSLLIINNIFAPPENQKCRMRDHTVFFYSISQRTISMPSDDGVCSRVLYLGGWQCYIENFWDHLCLVPWLPTATKCQGIQDKEKPSEELPWPWRNVAEQSRLWEQSLIWSTSSALSGGELWKVVNNAKVYFIEELIHIATTNLQAWRWWKNTHY